MTTYLGTGWVCNTISLLIKEVDTASDPGLDRLSSDGWRIVDDASYYAGDDGNDVINPSYVQAHEFIVSQSDMDTSLPYYLHSGHTINIDFRSSGATNAMTFGNEQFFYGNVTTTTKRTKYKTAFSLQMPQDEFNTSNNSTFDPDIDIHTYLTEVGILDNENRLVAVGKFTQPVEKNNEQFLVLQLEMEF